MVLRKRESR